MKSQPLNMLSFINPNGIPVAHICSSGQVRPYLSLLCSVCRKPEQDLTLRELCKLVNDSKVLKCKQN